MKYNAKIEYTGNVERAGKLTLTGEDGSTLLSKVPVAMPDEIFEGSRFFEKIHSTRAVQVKMDEELRKFDKSGKYEESYAEVVKNNPEGFFIKNASKVLVRPTNDAKMKNDDHAFVMHKEHFDVLFDLLAKKHQLEFETEKVAFLWFPEKVINATGGVNVALSHFDSVEATVKNQKEDAERIQALETAQKKAKVNVGTTKPKLSDAVNNISKIVEQEAKNTVKPVVTKPAKPQTTSQGKQSVIQAVPSRATTTTYRNDNDSLDALDIVLMYNNPDLAPFIRPNSSLAWYLYFNNRNNVDKSYVEQNIQNVPGFEDVGSSEFKYTPKGYSVTLFDDENKTNPVGRMEFDSQRNCYEVVSNNGEKTLLSIGDNGQIQSCFKASNGNETRMDLIQTDKGFVGNWESDNNGVKVNSGIAIDNDFGYSSSPNETVDLSRVQSSNVDNNYSSKVDSTFDFGYKADVAPAPEKEYVPPPPPPPKNDEVWGSSDPYSNGASFRM